MFFSKRDVENAMLAAEERSQRNVLHLMDLNIQGRYKTLLWDKVDAIKTVKRNVRYLSNLIVSGLEPYRDLDRQGLIDRENAQDMALHWIKSLHSSGVYSFIYGPDNKAVYHPRKELIGQDLSRIRDIKGRVMVEAARDEAERFGSGFATFRDLGLDGDTVVKQFAYFISVPGWDWVVATVSFIGDVEQDILIKRREIVQVLQENVSQVRIARSGFVFLFNGEKKMLVTPSKERAAQLQEAMTEQGPLLEVLMHLAHAKDKKKLSYTLPAPDGDPLAMESYASYFKPLDWYIVTVAPQEEIQSPARNLLQRQGYIFLGVFVVGLILALMFAARLANPLARLTEHAKLLPEQDFTQPAPEESPIRDLPAKYHDEVGRLAESFIFMEQSLRENIVNLMQVTASKQRIESELSIASDIQMGLLPKIFPPFPDRPEFDLFAFIHPAKEVGGDLYDFFFLDDTHLCFSVGDVSDKGVPAALFMAVTKTLINVVAEQTHEPAEILSQVNNELARDNPNAMFVTLIIAIIDLETGNISYANGGHNRPVLVNKQGVDFITGVSGPMAGAMEDMPFTPLEISLEPGDTLLLYTDGVTEAMNTKMELYSDQKLIDTVASMPQAPPQEMVDGILQSVKEHAGEATQSDDITMLCLRYNGSAQKS